MNVSHGESQVDGSGEVLYENHRTRITRVASGGDSGTAVVKEYLGADADSRLRHEVRLMERLRGVPGIIQPHPSVRAARGLALVDAGRPP